MKQFLKRISKMSLLQQMTLIIFTFVAVFVFFFVFYLRGNISDFVVNQCMSILQRSQETVVENIRHPGGGYSELTYDSGVIHFVYEDGRLSKYYGAGLYDGLVGQKVDELAGSHSEGWIESTFEVKGERYYYRMQTVDENTVVVSIMDRQYGETIESSLLSSVANNTTIIMLLLFILLMLWVSSVIAPLQTIQNYIEKVRQGDETAQLKLDREDEIGHLANALVEMREEIRSQEATKEEMIHNISHDLKTPIAVIKSYAESIKDGIYPYDTLDKSVDVIIENADRLERKVQSLLFLNRLDFVMEQEKDTDKQTDMVALVKSVTTSMKMIHQEIEVEKYLEKGTSFRGDEESWRVVVSNLLDNALRYASGRVVIDVHEDTLTVFNDGEQITQDQMNKLFKPFEKGDKGKFGLGLSICSKVCSTYGYVIEAENMPNGVMFIISPKPEEKKGRKG